MIALRTGALLCANHCTGTIKDSHCVRRHRCDHVIGAPSFPKPTHCWPFWEFGYCGEPALPLRRRVLIHGIQARSSSAWCIKVAIDNSAMASRLITEGVSVELRKPSAVVLENETRRQGCRRSQRVIEFGMCEYGHYSAINRVVAHRPADGQIGADEIWRNARAAPGVPRECRSPPTGLHAERGCGSPAEWSKADAQ